MWNAPSEEDFLNGVAPATYEQWVAQTEAAFYAYVAENGKAPYPTRATTAADQIGKTVFFSNLPTDRPYDFGVDYYYPGLNVYDPPECNPVASADGSSFCTYR